LASEALILATKGWPSSIYPPDLKVISLAPAADPTVPPTSTPPSSAKVTASIVSEYPEEKFIFQTIEPLSALSFQIAWSGAPCAFSS